MKPRNRPIHNAGRVGMDAWAKLYGPRSGTTDQGGHPKSVGKRKQNHASHDSPASPKPRQDPNVARFGADTLPAPHLLQAEADPSVSRVEVLPCR